MATEFADTRDKETLHWVQPVAGNRYHELRSRKGVHAKLKWKGMYGSLAYVLTNEGTFTLKRAGFLNPHVTVRMRPENTEIAKFNVDLGITGTIELRDGSKFNVRRPSALRRRWAVFSTRTDWDERPLLTIKNAKTGKFAAEVYFRADPRNTGFLILISAIIWYAFILSTEEWTGEPEMQNAG